MLIILSPAKTMGNNIKLPKTLNYTIPEHIAKSKELISLLKKYTINDLGKLMRINPKLAQLNYERFQNWELPFTIKNSYPAIFSYFGEVYNGLNPKTFTVEELAYAQTHLRILSGLYGVEKPLDLIQPYRLEMGLKISLDKYKDLYTFWKDDITNSIKEALKQQGDNILINLASNEYYKAIKKSEQEIKVINPVFKEFKNGKAKIVTMYTKKARGMLARYIIKNQLKAPEHLKTFEEDGYYYNEALSQEETIVFTR